MQFAEDVRLTIQKLERAGKLGLEGPVHWTSQDDFSAAIWIEALATAMTLIRRVEE